MPIKSTGNGSSEKQFRLAIELQGRKRLLGFNQAFALAHRYSRQAEDAAAVQILQKLNQAKPDDVPVRLLLARGFARVGFFAECKALLVETFGAEHTDLAKQLHDALVLPTFGAKEEAYQELVDVAQHHPELPTVCLILGDLWERIGRLDKVEQLWKLAARRASKAPHIKHSIKVQFEDLRRGSPGGTSEVVASTGSHSPDSNTATHIGQDGKSSAIDDKGDKRPRLPETAHE